MEDAQDSKTLKKDMDKAPDIETEIKRAISLTLEGVRRLLEKDLGLKTNALDVHKRFIKQCLQECFDAAADENVSKNSGEDGEKYDCSGREETEKLPEGLQPEKEVKEPISVDEEKMEGSPVLGLLAGHKMTQHDTEETQGIENQEVPSEDTLKKAIKKRSSYFRANSEKLTLVGARRLLEEDLKLDKNSLDAHKKFITEQLDEVLKSPEVAKSANGVIKKRVKKTVHRKPPSKVSSEGSSDSLDSEDEKVDEDEVKPPKKISSKGNAQNSEGLKKRKRSAKETKNSSNKGNKAVEPMSEGSTDAEDGGDGSEDGHSQSSAEKLVKKKEVSTQAYGKHVEHLKSIIKSCAMSVPPTVYKRVKQAPESKRESYLIKELEAILGKEGLSTNPSEKVDSATFYVEDVEDESD
ncbi:hypothetical protein HHK36_030409 [Tetracentron sinense]|uniref:DEK-C domain-containing protein n=1 Tax=Tetracentron sinense TaxID=13715 RepID=A0A835CYN7_TETSI|nr:hypothetical protein HHK36_030409 [Tetracentron sinense]